MPAATVIREPGATPTLPPASPELEEVWTRLIESVGRASPFTRTYLLEAHPVSFDKNLFVIGFDPEFEDHIGLVDNARNHTLLQTKLLELGHPNAQIKFIKAEAPLLRSTPATGLTPTPAAPASPAGPSRSAPSPAKKDSAPGPVSQQDFKNDPLIQKALEVFKGQIVEVRA